MLIYKTPPFDHQREFIDKHATDTGHALWWDQGCVDGNTEYLSPNGWRAIRHYDGGLVAQWWPGGKSEFVRPSDYVIAPCYTMFHIQHKYGIDQMLSPEHRMALLTKHAHQHYEAPVSQVVHELRQSNIARALPTTFCMSDNGKPGLGLTDTQLRLQIAIMADGHFPKNCGTKRCVVRLKRPRKIARMRQLLADIADVYERPCQTTRGFVIFSFEAPIKSKTYGDAIWQQANIADLGIIIDEIFHWDGDTTKKIYRTALEADADFIQLALGCHGYAASKTYGKHWQIRVRSSAFSIRAQHITEATPIDNKKYCFTVPSTFLIFRRNGCIFPSGNTGKSKALIDNGTVLFDLKEIRGLFYIGPNGLHRNFITKEIPKHLSDELAELTKCLFWRTDKAKTKWHQEEARTFLKHPGYKILAMSYDGLVTDTGKALAKEFLMSTRCLYGLDEAARIKESDAWRTQVVLASAPYAPFRRGMTGTPVANAPWDVYTQVKFLQDDFWKPIGLDSPEAMKTTFGEWEKGRRKVSLAEAIHAPKWKKHWYEIPRNKETGQPTGVAFLLFDQLQRDEAGQPQYKNLERLQQIVAPITSRVLKSDVFDLPEKIHSYLEFELTPKQRAAYESLKKLGFAAIDGGMCTANLAITILLRLQQISCGYLVADIDPQIDDEPRVIPIMPNPRMDLLLELTEDLNHQALIWARFRADIRLICEALKKQGKTYAQYDGQISADECAENEDRFHRGDAQFFVSNQAKGGEGLTLIEAETAIYYSHSFKLTEWLQSSDRPYRYGQTKKVHEISLVGSNTVDEPIIGTLHSKQNVANVVTGDVLRDWMKGNSVPRPQIVLDEPAPQWYG